MKSLLTIAALLLVALIAQPSQAATLLEISGEPPEATVEMDADGLALITPKAIAGSSIAIKVNGKAKAKVYSVQKIGGEPQLLGPTSQRILFTPSKAGKVTLKVTISHPTLKEPKTDIYTFQVN
ncbi:hypothetical protein [Blastopirellula marina]|nr:hypothetical protein [Blastopirellula marina]